jgi:hypothetical protein
MPTKQLDFIATTPVSRRKPIMSRIRCKDGLSFSVQASKTHFCKNEDVASLCNGNDEGPWTSLEVGFISNTKQTPCTWSRYVVSKYHAFSRNHDLTGLDPAWTPIVYCVPLEEIRSFIKDHGGEIEDLHFEVLVLREKMDEKWIELQAARGAERAISNDAVENLLPQINLVALEEIRGRYAAAGKKVQKLFDEWIALLERLSILDKQEQAELERELRIAKEQLGD